MGCIGPSRPTGQSVIRRYKWLWKCYGPNWIIIIKLLLKILSYSYLNIGDSITCLVGFIPPVYNACKRILLLTKCVCAYVFSSQWASDRRLRWPSGSYFGRLIPKKIFSRFWSERGGCHCYRSSRTRKTLNCNSKLCLMWFSRIIVISRFSRL